MCAISIPDRIQHWQYLLSEKGPSWMFAGEIYLNWNETSNET